MVGRSHWSRSTSELVIAVPVGLVVCRRAVVCFWPLTGAQFVVIGVMELDKMDENDWKYHGEGNKSLVVSHVQVTRRG